MSLLQAAKQALEALHNTQNALLFVSGSVEQYSLANMTADAHDDADKAITALHQAIAQAEQQEPVAGAREVIEECQKALFEELMAWDIDPPIYHVKKAHDLCVTWLNTAPQQRKEWREPSDAQITQAWLDNSLNSEKDFASAILKLCKELNHG